MSGWDRPAPWLTLGALLSLGSAPRVATAPEAAIAGLLGRRPTPAATALGWTLEVDGRLALGRGEAVVASGGRFGLELRGPVGLTPVLRLRGDGVGVAVTAPGPRQHWVAPEADAVLGAVGAPDLAALGALAVGVVPVDHDDLREVRVMGDGWWTRWDLRDHVLVLELDRAGTPRRGRVLGDDGLPLAAVVWSPDTIVLHAPDARATLTLDELAWRPHTPTPTAFALDVPDGFRAAPLAYAWRDGAVSDLVRRLER